MLILRIFQISFFALVLGGADGRKKEKDIFQVIEDNNEKRHNVAYSAGGATEKLVEGDIVDTLAVEAVRNGKGGLNDATAKQAHLWPNGVVPYVFAPGSGKKLKKAVKAAADDYADKTCIRWKAVSRKRAKRYESYVEFFNGFGCFSMIGRQRGKQQISLGYGCQEKGIALHEMMHALGFWHEQSRMDRDKHIRILKWNIKKGFENNFKKYSRGEATTLGMPYDERSIMHYGAYSFSKNGKPTIKNKHNRKGKIGQRKGLSKIDIGQLNKLYKCSESPGKSNSRRRMQLRRKSNSRRRMLLRRKSKRKGGMRRKSRRRSKAKNAECKDRHKHCAGWKREGHCKKKKYVAFMRISCRKSCNFC